MWLYKTWSSNEGFKLRAIMQSYATQSSTDGWRSNAKPKCVSHTCIALILAYKGLKRNLKYTHISHSYDHSFKLVIIIIMIYWIHIKQYNSLGACVHIGTKKSSKRQVHCGHNVLDSQSYAVPIASSFLLRVPYEPRCIYIFSKYWESEFS